jgi:hypothetical protein
MVEVGVECRANSCAVLTLAPTALNDLRFRQILNARNALAGIGQVFSWPRRGGTLRGNAFFLL